MIRSLFINKQALEKGAVRPPADVPDQSVKKVGVLGAGMMGAGIALVSAKAGIEVVLIDQTQEAADKGKAYSASYMDKGIARKKTTPEKKDALLNLIIATTDLDALKGCDLIVEAVFEDPGVKAEMTQKVEAVVGEDCIFATNTSTLPITDLAKASVRPEQFIGIHFFSPVEKMLLVEIIKGKETGDRAVAKALDYVRQIRKTPIVVNDARFFYANRCIIPYINEGIRMVGEGGVAPPALIEGGAARLLGFPVGPLQLVDETSIDLGVKIAKATRAAMGDAYPDSAVDEVVFWMFDEGAWVARRTPVSTTMTPRASAPSSGKVWPRNIRWPRINRPDRRAASPDDGPGAGGRARPGRRRADGHSRGRRGRNPGLGGLCPPVVGRSAELARHDRCRESGGDLRWPDRTARRALHHARHPARHGRKRRRFYSRLAA